MKAPIPLNEICIDEGISPVERDVLWRHLVWQRPFQHPLFTGPRGETFTVVYRPARRDIRRRLSAREERHSSLSTSPVEGYAAAQARGRCRCSARRAMPPLRRWGSCRRSSTRAMPPLQQGRAMPPLRRWGRGYNHMTYLVATCPSRGDDDILICGL